MDVLPPAEFFSVLIDRRILEKNGRYETRHILDFELDNHYANSPDFYEPSDRNCASGRVKLTLANDVELVLDDVSYDPLRRHHFGATVPRVYISLKKLLATPGVTFDTEIRGHWHVLKNAKLLVFGMKDLMTLDAAERYALGPTRASRERIANAQALQGAIPRSNPQVSERPPRALPRAIVRPKAHESNKPQGIPEDTTPPRAIVAPDLKPTPVPSIGATSNSLLFQEMAHPTFGSVRRGEWQEGCLHEVRHVLSSTLKDHLVHSLDFYQASDRDRIGRDGQTWGSGDEFVSGTIKITISNNVELVLHDVIYRNMPEPHVTPIRPRIFISLPKLLESPGMTFEVEENGHWHILRNGKLHVFGVKPGQGNWLNPECRGVLGPIISHALATANPQALQGAITLGPSRSDERPPRVLPTATIMPTAQESSEPLGIPGQTGRVTIAAAPKPRLNPVRSSGAVSSSSAAVSAQPASVSLPGRSRIIPDIRSGGADRRPPVPVQNIGGVWLSNPGTQSAVPTTAPIGRAAEKAEQISSRAPENKGKSKARDDIAKPNPPTAQPVVQKPAVRKPVATKAPQNHPAALRKASFLDRILGVPIQSVPRESLKARSSRASTRAKATIKPAAEEQSQMSVRTGQAAATATPNKVYEKPVKGVPVKLYEKYPEGVGTWGYDGYDEGVRAKALGFEKPAKEGSGKDCEKDVDDAGAKVPLKQGGSARDPRDAGRNRWSKLSPNDLPRAGKDTR